VIFVNLIKCYQGETRFLINKHTYHLDYQGLNGQRSIVQLIDTRYC